MLTIALYDEHAVPHAESQHTLIYDTCDRNETQTTVGQMVGTNSRHMHFLRMIHIAHDMIYMNTQQWVTFLGQFPGQRWEYANTSITYDAYVT